MKKCYACKNELSNEDLDQGYAHVYRCKKCGNINYCPPGLGE